MSYMDKLAGVFPPLVTPLDRDGRVDEPAMRKLISRTIEGGAEGVVVLGTTGEGPMLERAERYRAIAIAVDEARGRVPGVCRTYPRSPNPRVEGEDLELLQQRFEELSN